MIYEESLPNSVKIIHEYIPYSKTVSIGIWLREGSRDESDEKSGILHFIEHMLFKGSEKFNYREIAKITDRLGGEIDAFTSKEFMGINCKVLDKNFHKAMELISEIFLNPLFLDEEIENEKKVILEEIKSMEDDPEDLSIELFFKNYMKGHSLGRSILGYVDTVKSLKRKDLLDRHSSSFISSKVFVSSSGSINFEEVKKTVEKNFGALPYIPNSRNLSAPKLNPGLYYKSKKEMEQVHIVLGFPGFSQKDKKRFPFFILNEILAGSFSSRLFQKIREERGLAYSVGSSPATFLDCGVWTIFCDTNKKNLKEVMEVMKDELEKIRDGDINEDEVERGKEHLKGGFLLNLESSTSRMAYLARNELYHGEQISPDFFLEEIDRTELEEIKGVALELIDFKNSAIFLLGDLPKPKEIERLSIIRSI